jgi:phenylacetic acid degradation operon negative regulatory protein
MRSKQLKKEIFRISEGILSTVTDILLWEIVYLGESATTFSRNTWDARTKADRFLEEINYETIKRAIQLARDKGWVKKARRRRVWPEITASGRERLSSLIPRYDTKRVWDEKFYLVTYDIAESRKKERELLREYLKRIGAGMIQESVWLTPYDPNDILREFAKERKLKGSIIVSNLGRDGSVGEEDMKDLLRRIYKLDKINKDYEEFLEKFTDVQISASQTPFAYWRILKNDPQLPFELLPNDWLGRKAYQLFLKSQKLST